MLRLSCFSLVQPTDKRTWTTLLKAINHPLREHLAYVQRAEESEGVHEGAVSAVMSWPTMITSPVTSLSSYVLPLDLAGNSRLKILLPNEVINLRLHQTSEPQDFRI